MKTVIITYFVLATSKTDATLISEPLRREISTRLGACNLVDVLGHQIELNDSCRGPRGLKVYTVILEAALIPDVTGKNPKEFPGPRRDVKKSAA
jgi:hypothetical protein